MLVRIIIISLMVTLLGCGRSSDSSDSATGILAPFQGDWRFSLSKTLARWKADGVPDDEIAQAQKAGSIFPLHPDMGLRSNTAVLPGVVDGEYLFFALHPHAQFVCGKAWHHEDRHDPGDMDKYLVRLQIRDGDLLLSARTTEDSADPDDPDVTSTPITAGSAETCDADKLPSPPWSRWQTYVFERGGGKETESQSSIIDNVAPKT